MEDVFPPFALTITAGALQLRFVRDDDLRELGALALRGIHDPATMPFAVPWTDVEPRELPGAIAAYHWLERATFGPDAWALILAARHDGRLVGTQSFAARDFLVTRSGETGSWLGREYQGRGIGTAMRRAVCTFVFDHLDAVEAYSPVFSDNPASYAVGRKVGYVEEGIERVQRRPGELAIKRRMVLRPESLVRDETPLVVEGVAALRRFIGLPERDEQPS